MNWGINIPSTKLNVYGNGSKDRIGRYKLIKYNISYN